MKERRRRKKKKKKNRTKGKKRSQKWSKVTAGYCLWVPCVCSITILPLIYELWKLRYELWKLLNQTPP